jgi:hypothetical protein
MTFTWGAGTWGGGPRVSATDILTHAGRTSPTAEETAWAELIANALEAVMTHRLVGVTITNDLAYELQRAALLDGIAAFVERSAPHGIISMGPDGDVARLGARLTRALEPVLQTYAGPGIG